MAIYLNTNRPLENYKKLLNAEYFVDKSNMIEKTNRVINTSNCYICITRPRRFGKSSVADMLGAYYSKAVSSKEIFETLNISKSASYDEHLNKYNVISISFNKLPNKIDDYNDYISLIQQTLIDDIKSMYPDLEFKSYFTISPRN